MAGPIVEDLLMKQKHVTCINVQLMEDGAFGDPGHLAMLTVVEELKQEEESAINHLLLMEELSVEEILLKQKHVTRILVPQFLRQLMENGVPGHPGLLVIKAAMVDLGQERKTVIIQSQSMVGWTVLEKVPMTQKVVTSITVQSAPRTAIAPATRTVSGKRIQEKKMNYELNLLSSW